MRIFHFLIASLFCACPIIANTQQPRQSDNDNPMITKGYDFEANSSNLESLAATARASEQRVFIIARPGKDERSRYVNEFRLMLARNYMLLWLKPNSVIGAEGGPTQGNAKLEFYLGSKLMIISEMHKTNGRFAVGTECEAPCTITSQLAHKFVEEDRRKRDSTRR